VHQVASIRVNFLDVKYKPRSLSVHIVQSLGGGGYTVQNLAFPKAETGWLVVWPICLLASCVAVINCGSFSRKERTSIAASAGQMSWLVAIGAVHRGRRVCVGETEVDEGPVVFLKKSRSGDRKSLTARKETE
jgi:hypothetical protein